MDHDERFVPQEGVSLAEFCTFGIGGPAQYFVTVKTIPALVQAVTYANQNKLKFFILGKGSNCLFDDRGFKGLVIQNKIDFFDDQSPLFRVGAGFSFSLLGAKTARLGFAGLEFAAGIPGTVGGAIYMNAGANGAETKDSLISVDYLHSSGEFRTYMREELFFAYRTSSFQKMEGAIVAASFELAPSSQARQKQIDIIQYRTTTQPYKDKSAGCIFRNHSQASAGALIDRHQLKGLRIGGAEVSTKHANFIVNSGQATSSDVLNLIQEIKNRVKEASGYDLEPEVKVIPYE